MSANELKADLRDLYISAAKELEIGGGRKAVVIFVPFRQLKDFHKIQPRLVRELEKKFRYFIVVFFCQKLSCILFLFEVILFTLSDNHICSCV